MNPAQISRLKEEQEKAIHHTDEKIQQLEKFKSDYEALRTRLTTLPDYCQYEVMVPFGPLAFMPGQLIHTNEILVLLGDNWFADRSAKQAAEIVGRRITSVNKSLEELCKQKQLLEPRLDFTTELKDISENRLDMKEINEELTEEEEKQWREKHRKYLRSNRKKVSNQDTKNQVEQKDDVDDLWARLDELERIEAQKNEFQLLGDEPLEAASLFESSGKQWEKRSPEQTTEDFLNSSTSTEESSDEEVMKARTHITFLHTTASQQDKDEASVECSQSETITEQSEGGSSSNATIHTPGDIYEHFLKTYQPKSILKKSQKSRESLKTKKSVTLSEDISSSSVKGEAEEADKKLLLEKQAQERLKAFSGVVLEKTLAPAADSQESGDAPNVVPKRVSKFKADRQKHQHGGVR